MKRMLSELEKKGSWEPMFLLHPEEVQGGWAQVARVVPLPWWWLGGTGLEPGRAKMCGAWESAAVRAQMGWHYPEAAWLPRKHSKNG